MKILLFDKKLQHFQLLITVFISLVLFGLVFYLFYNQPIAYVHLIVEDSWGEYGTFMCYLASFFILLWVIVKNPDLRKPGYILLALCFFIMAMEEVSWLQRILEIKTPDEIAVINTQYELNFHNISYIKHTKKIFSYLIIFWALALPFIVKKYELIRKTINKMGIPILPVYLIPLFVLALFFFLFKPIPKFDEINELIFGIGFTCYSIHLLLYSYKEAPAFPAIQKTIPIVLLSILILSTGFLSNTWPYTDDHKFRFNQFASEIYYAQGKHDQARTLYRYILDKPELIDETTLFNYALYLNETGQKNEAHEVFIKALRKQNDLIKAHPRRAAYHIITAKIYSVLNDHSKSKMHFDRAIDLYNAEIESVKEPSFRWGLLLQLADTYLLSQQFNKAAENYRLAFSMAPSESIRDYTIHHIQKLIKRNLRGRHMIIYQK